MLPQYHCNCAINITWQTNFNKQTLRCKYGLHLGAPPPQPPTLHIQTFTPHPAWRVLINDGNVPMGPARLRLGQADL